MTTWLSSDFHLNHANIISYSGRPYSSVDEMNDALITNSNARVAKDDVVYFLGDFAMGQEKHVPNFFRRLNGIWHLILGNHDPPHPAHRSHKNNSVQSVADATKRYLDYGFASVQLTLELEEFSLHHMPAVDYTDKRYGEYRPKKVEGRVLLHGHVHEKFKYRDGQYNVGVDRNNYQPISLEEVRAFLATKPANC
jgi:calcineurin-like phosphoesterase family protein